jgi:hypothetical protein
VERVDRIAARFSARYGVRHSWSDEQIERALADHGLPWLALLPGEPRGMMTKMAPQFGPLDDLEAHSWLNSRLVVILGPIRGLPPPVEPSIARVRAA